MGGEDAEEVAELIETLKGLGLASTDTNWIPELTGKSAAAKFEDLHARLQEAIRLAKVKAEKEAREAAEKKAQEEKEAAEKAEREAVAKMDGEAKAKKEAEIALRKAA